MIKNMLPLQVHGSHLQLGPLTWMKKPWQSSSCLFIFSKLATREGIAKESFDQAKVWSAFLDYSGPSFWKMFKRILQVWIFTWYLLSSKWHLCRIPEIAFWHAPLASFSHDPIFQSSGQKPSAPVKRSTGSYSCQVFWGFSFYSNTSIRPGVPCSPWWSHSVTYTLGSFLPFCNITNRAPFLAWPNA